LFTFFSSSLLVFVSLLVWSLMVRLSPSAARSPFFALERRFTHTCGGGLAKQVFDDGVSVLLPFRGSSLESGPRVPQVLSAALREETHLPAA